MNKGLSSSTRKHGEAFTLLELLVVIAIIGVLIAILAPAIEKSVERSRLAVCGENLHALSTGIHMYSSEFNDVLPVGSSTPSSNDPSRAWNQLGDATAWIGSTSENNGLGLLSRGWCTNLKSYLCPFNDDKTFDAAFLKNFNQPGGNAYSSYMYRQLDQTQRSRLTNLGNNGKGNPANALMMDWQSEGAAPYNHTSHDVDEFLNVLYADGHIQSFPNRADVLAYDKSDFTSIPSSVTARTDQLWVTADWAESSDPATAPKLP